MLQPSVPAWFEIPSADLDRAVRFYEKVLDTRLRREDMGPMRMAVFPSEKPLPTGAIVHAPGYAPAEAGTILYLNVDDIRPVLGRVPGGWQISSFYQAYSGHPIEVYNGRNRYRGNARDANGFLENIGGDYNLDNVGTDHPDFIGSSASAAYSHKNPADGIFTDNNLIQPVAYIGA